MVSALVASPKRNIEEGLEVVWRAYRKKKGGGDPSFRLSKRQLALLSEDQSNIIRNCYKRDDHMVTSTLVADMLVDDRSAFLETAAMLHTDAKTGGRYKRVPCYPVASLNETHLLVLNGGWSCVDESTRVTTEASKFAQAAASSATSTTATAQTSKDISASLSESILRRLETLAMGDENLDVGDVGTRETLKKMDLPITPSGAKSALIKLNRWTTASSNTPKIMPFDEATLIAAKTLQQEIQAKTLQTPPPLPSFTIDSRKTAFRDDAITLRPRPKSKVVKGNKWELVISIADVSAIFDLSPLSTAASTRCMSRYDLPLGPLHLMPPTALTALSFGGGTTEAVSVAVYIDEKTGNVLDCSVERNAINTKALTFESCNEALRIGEGGEATALRIIENLLISWSDQRMRNSEASRRRNSKLNAKTSGSANFDRSPAHRLVDTSLDLYSYAATRLMREAKASVPRMPGSSASKGGRLATAPLRRYIDCMAQRQILSVLCKAENIKPLSNEECREVSETSGKQQLYATPTHPMAIASHGMTKTQYHHVIKIPKQYMSAPTKSPAALYVVRVTSVMMTRGVRARPMNRG
ncbi:hypothetical protein TrRE_jg10970, partial [Triparma retinervis]